MPEVLPQSTSTLSWQHWPGGVSLVQVAQTRLINLGGDPKPQWRPLPSGAER